MNNQNNRPLVSIAIPVYNHELYIAKAVESVLMQETSFDFEIVIGDDCSTDKTREILLSFKEKYPEKINLLLAEKNCGVLRNSFNIFKNCKGKYIAMLEGDDYWSYACKLQKQVDFLELNDDYTGCFHDARVVSQQEDDTDNPNKYLKNYKLSEKILNIGLQANPLDAELINNIAYACALNNDVEKAEHYLSHIKSDLVTDYTTEICLLATRGLVDFRKGLYDSGRELYLRAIDKTTEYKDSPNLNWTAILNYAREELRVNPAAKERIAPLISQIHDNHIDEDTKVLKNDVMLLIE